MTQNTKLNNRATHTENFVLIEGAWKITWKGEKLFNFAKRLTVYIDGTWELISTTQHIQNTFHKLAIEMEKYISTN